MNTAFEVDQKIVECVDSALQKFGESVKTSIYYYLEKDFNLGKSEIPRNPEAFENALTAIFGEQGGKVIKELILAEIKNNFKLKREPDLTFNKIVAMIRSSSKH
jgi:hypothetical protein